MVLKYRYFLLQALLLNSCVQVNSINDRFNEKYYEAIDILKMQRSGDPLTNKQNFVSKAPSDSEIAGDKTAYYSDIMQFGQKSNLGIVQSSENYSSSGISKNAEPNLFEINYSSNLQSFSNPSGVEFDNIPIPEYDAYGIKTKMSEKNYFLLGGDLLQRSIDKTIDSKGEFDNKNAVILVKEKKQILRKKLMNQIFGNNTDILPKKKIITKDKKNNKKDKKKMDNLSRIIDKNTPVARGVK